MLHDVALTTGSSVLSDFPDGSKHRLFGGALFHSQHSADLRQREVFEMPQDKGTAFQFGKLAQCDIQTFLDLATEEDVDPDSGRTRWASGCSRSPRRERWIGSRDVAYGG